MTFTVDDVFISDESSVLIHHNKQSGDPASKGTAINIDYSKCLSRTSGFTFMKHTCTNRAPECIAPFYINLAV